LERTEAVDTALSLGMPVREIEEYLDWLDVVRPLRMDISAAEDPLPGPEIPQATGHRLCINRSSNVDKIKMTY
jgi:hypothetical protein